MTNLEVARHGILLLRSNDISKRLHAVQPEDLSLTTVLELHRWNELLQENTVPEKDGSPNKKIVPQDSLNENNSRGGKKLAASVETALPTLLKAHLVCIVNRYRAYKRDVELASMIEVLNHELMALQAENRDVLQARLDVLEKKRHLVETQLSAANAQSMYFFTSICLYFAAVFAVFIPPDYYYLTSPSPRIFLSLFSPSRG